jgi:hypothetical protein
MRAVLWEWPLFETRFMELVLTTVIFHLLNDSFCATLNFYLCHIHNKSLFAKFKSLTAIVLSIHFIFVCYPLSAFKWLLELPQTVYPEYEQYDSLWNLHQLNFRLNVYGSVHRKYIPIYIQQDATLHSLFISGNCSTCFGWYLHPSSGAQTSVSTASGISHTVTATYRYTNQHRNLYLIY